MKAQTDSDRSGPELGAETGLMTRRRLACALTAFGAAFTLTGLSSPLLAQTPVVAPPAPALVPPPGPLPEPDEIAVLANLITRMSTETMINGRPGFNLVLDTGAGSSVIAADLAEALQLPAGPRVLVHGVTAAEIAPTARIARLAFAGRRFNGVNAAVFPRHMLAADGLLGLDVLSNFELSFDMVRRTLKLTPASADTIEFGRAFGASSRIPRGESVRTRRGRFGQLIMLGAQADGVPVQAYIDSGAQLSIGNMALFRALGGREGPTLQRAQIQVFGVTGQSIMADHGSVGMLVINRNRLGPQPLLFADLHAFEALDMISAPALLIGGDILARFRTVSLDFARSRMSFSGLRRPLDSVGRI